nr:immunoglobulin heavy chain junction region [Mus musculus]NSM03882.1 immunoglobulin heavy chain junction region [Mus musculus]NSM04034.1 immunoglobulin heavy chain junction region [Mus musculus]NSM04071.1 immunoglobulin heavy chain junction region [Mus musculus]NSM04116.1 immunoglobulin heavy chain junction region [Mus musculus]
CARGGVYGYDAANFDYW